VVDETQRDTLRHGVRACHHSDESPASTARQSLALESKFDAACATFDAEAVGICCASHTCDLRHWLKSRDRFGCRAIDRIRNRPRPSARAREQIRLRGGCRHEGGRARDERGINGRLG
jgi:hypothetical protein